MVLAAVGINLLGLDNDTASREKLEGFRWIASKRYKRGEISAKPLEDSEHLHFARQEENETENIRRIVSLAIAFFFAFWILLGLTEFLVNGSFVIIGSSPILLLVLFRILSRYSSKHN
jgi:hypothetical protein